MAAALIWTPQSEEDLLDIYVAIGLDSPAAADKIYDRLKDVAQLCCAITLLLEPPARKSGNLRES
ncbi:type II toxin-antitoxin system RelE/ParE family toxin [Labrys neptuniae]|uniref:Type II toxin-antitoxin system RelE/ParE family toxin n=1 Tax=Labrys neptuniae TaxID=376174 RepID=A0ABV3PQ74_9HYPH|nr:type II toxin-antitoxin system RelE/ParE family toxin [Labrys neptuniae]MDT3380981.1 type II toxin-antitoxin system RelE/ParE family toxin [Labrys neptuniae]